MVSDFSAGDGKIDAVFYRVEVIIIFILTSAAHSMFNFLHGSHLYLIIYVLVFFRYIVSVSCLYGKVESKPVTIMKN